MFNPYSMEGSMTLSIIMAVFAGLALLVSLLGWAYQLGRSDARLSRNEQDVLKLNAQVELLQAQREADAEKLRTQISAGFSKIYEKIDALPCHKPGWGKEAC